MLPEGLVYLDSWVASDRFRCFQLMATDDERLLGAWIEKWADLVVFEIVPVVPSLEMQSRLSAPK